MSENKYHQCLFLGCNFKTKDHKKLSKHLDKCTTVKVNTGSYPRDRRNRHEIFETLVENYSPPKQNEKVTKYSNTLLEALAQGKLNFLAVENPDS